MPANIRRIRQGGLDGLFAMADSGMIGQAVGLHEPVDEFSGSPAQHVDDHHVAIAVKALIRRSDNAVVVGRFDPAFVRRKRFVEVDRLFVPASVRVAPQALAPLEFAFFPSRDRFRSRL